MENLENACRKVEPPQLKNILFRWQRELNDLGWNSLYRSTMTSQELSKVMGMTRKHSGNYLLKC